MFRTVPIRLANAMARKIFENWIALKEPMTDATNKAGDRPSRNREVVVRNPRYAGAKTPGNVIRAMAKSKGLVRNRAKKGEGTC